MIGCTYAPIFQRECNFNANLYNLYYTFDWGNKVLNEKRPTHFFAYFFCQCWLTWMWCCCYSLHQWYATPYITIITMDFAILMLNTAPFFLTWSILIHRVFDYLKALSCNRLFWRHGDTSAIPASTAACQSALNFLNLPRKCTQLIAILAAGQIVVGHASFTLLIIRYISKDIRLDSVGRSAYF